jgi:uncharacterized 2Fe-2S/4Fe-4S cluster protein (DUF4445 family)
MHPINSPADSAAVPSVSIELQPQGQRLRVPQGAALQDVLFEYGVEFPCGGRGRCKGCRVKVLSGAVPVSEEDRQRLNAQELAQGWRLACRARVESDLKLDLVQWEAAILSDDTPFAFKPQEGWGVAIDVGTTTLVAQLLDLQTGNVLAVASALNKQAVHGADIMSRIEFASTPAGTQRLQELIRSQLEEMIQHLIVSARSRGNAGLPTAAPRHPPPLHVVVLVGNTVMHHLFSRLNLEPLARYPFESPSLARQVFTADMLGWKLPEDTAVHFLPCVGGFVGSDVLAGVWAANLHQTEALVALLDLGTNGEIVLGNRDRLLCASTAAGPAFEGARISMGMRAATGAISEVRVEAGRLRCRVLGNAPPRGICGSGLVDAVAAGLELNRIQPNGRLAEGIPFEVLAPVFLTQQDIRELQLAKGAITAGLRLLLQKIGARPQELSRVYLAGAFGNYINQVSARRIGLLDFPAERITAAGNTALLGAKLALFSLKESDHLWARLLQRIEHVSLKEDPVFQDAYFEEMAFPAER